MASLASLMENTIQPEKLLIYGASGTGKTLLAGRLALLGYKVFFFDCENSTGVLFQLLAKNPEIGENIEVFKIADTPKNPQAIVALDDFFQGKEIKSCDTHHLLNCRECMLAKKPQTSLKLSTLQETPKAVLVIDSMTQILNSINSNIFKQSPVMIIDRLTKDDKAEWGHYNVQGLVLERIESYIQNTPIPIIVTSHEVEAKIRNREKIIPVGGTRNKSKEIMKFYGHVIYCYMEKNKHCYSSIGVKNTDIFQKSRYSIDIAEVPPEIGLAAFFEPKYIAQFRRDMQELVKENAGKDAPDAAPEKTSTEEVAKTLESAMTLAERLAKRSS